MEEDYNTKKAAALKKEKKGMDMSIAPSMFAERVNQSEFGFSVKSSKKSGNLH